MKLLTGFLSEAAAMTRSAALFPDIAGAVTQYRLTWIKHPDRSEWALRVPADEESRLTAEEQAALTADDWPVAEFDE